MSERVAVVIGAARGIGAATVSTLAADGWNVLAVDRCDDDPRLPYALGGAQQLAETVAAGRAAGSGRGAVESSVADATDLGALAAAIESAVDRFGGVDAIVSVAGVIAGGVPLWEMPVEQQDAVLDGCLVTSLNAARAGIPVLLRRPEPRRGRFVAVASTAAARGLPMLAAYCAAKAGVTGLIRALALELRETGITANAVSPGSTRTAILDESARLYDLESADRFALQQPIGRLLEPSEVAGAIAWLLSDQGAAVTGIDFPVDGGLAL